MAIVETGHAAGFLISEGNGNLSRDNGVLLSGQNLLAGAVVGKITTGGATSAAKSGGNTGNGTCVMDATTPVKNGAKVGVYTVRCITAATNGGVFRVDDPDGIVLGDVTITGGAGGTGVFDGGHIKFTLTDGGTDFVAGDGFDITIAAGSGKFKVLAPAAVDGSQAAAAILLADTDATAADAACALIRRQAEVNGNELLWPDGISAGEKATAIAQLEARGIAVR